MALIVMSGLPCSGKSSISAAIKSELESTSASAGLRVQVVDESLLALSRDTCYQDSVSEKSTRGRLKAAVERSLTKSSIVIFDSLNNIKGYRYEIWCVARACGCRYCLVHADIPGPVASAWNTSRASESYSSAVYKDLAGRYEMPDSKNRWEAPLFRIDPQSSDLSQAIQQVVSLACGGKQAGSQEPQHQQISQKARSLQPTVATTNQKLSSTNLLHDFDKASQEDVDTAKRMFIEYLQAHVH
ncbi:hypothetical protein WJX84_006362 [Apatococcus fuscideae]|uniref:Uncharacterized protein n=1 Tax=Apatococcus fuscideae TaxID=2026836 RepID=A0AAW1SI08_9CHLO